MTSNPASDIPQRATPASVRQITAQTKQVNKELQSVNPASEAVSVREAILNLPRENFSHELLEDRYNDTIGGYVRGCRDSASLAQQSLEKVERERDAWQEAAADYRKLADSHANELILRMNEIRGLEGRMLAVKGRCTHAEELLEKLASERDRYKELYEPFRPLSLEECEAAFDAIDESEVEPMPDDKVQHGVRYVLDAEYRANYLKEQLDDKTRLVVAGRRAVAEAQSQLSTLTADLAAKDAEIADYKTAVHHMNAMIDEREAELTTLRIAFEAAKGFVERLQLTGIDASRGLNDCFVLLRIWAGGYQSEDEGLKLAITGLKDIKDQLTAAMARGTE